VIGRWDLAKKPVRWLVSVLLQCGVCGREEDLSFESGFDFSEEVATQYPAQWRRLQPMGSPHDDPLRDRETVVCSEDCARKFAAAEIAGLYP